MKKLIKCNLKLTKNTFYKMVLSYILVLIIPIIIGTIFYAESFKIIKNESSNYKITMLKSVSNEIDSKLKEVERISNEISMNYTINGFINNKKPLNENDRYQIIHIIDSLKSYKNSNDFIKDVFIYYKNSDLLVTPDSMYQPDFFYKNIYNYNNINYNEWHDTLLTQKYYNYYIIDVINENNLKVNNQISYMQSLPITLNNPSANITILINENKFSDILKNVATEGIIYILDENNTVISSSEHTSDNALLSYSSLDGNSGIREISIKDEDFVITYIKSMRNSWKYVSIIPRYVFMAKVTEIKNTALIIVFLGFLMGSILSIYLAQRNYLPIKKIIDSIILNSDKKGVNELEFIKDTIIDVQNKNKQLEISSKEKELQNIEYIKRINNNSEIVKDMLLQKIMKEKNIDYIVTKEYLKFYNVEFFHSMFCIFIAKFEYDFEHGDLDIQYNKISTFINSVMENLNNQNCYVYMCEYENNSVSFILNYNKQISNEYIEQYIYNLINEIKDYVSKNYNLYLSCGIGNVCESIENVRASYKQAHKALEYRIIKGKGSIILYKDIVNEDKNYYYPIDTELKLINYIKTGDEENCKNILKNMYEENFIKRKLPISLIKCLFFNMMSTALKVLDEIKVNYSDIFDKESDPINQLTKCETVNEIFNETEIIYKNICLYINSNRVNHNDKLNNDILNYINMNFSNPNISQKYIADYFNITVPYLSKIFKQINNMNMVEYINRKRIEKVKELLKDSKITLTNISDLVGYNSDKTLIRIFKEYEGITPGKYREYLDNENKIIYL